MLRERKTSLNERLKSARPSTPSSSAPASPACTCCTACAGSASRRGSTRPAAASAAPGTGTAIPARAATSRACSIPSRSRRSSTSNGTGRRNTRRSRRSSPTPTMSPTASICAAHILFDTRVTAATFDEDAKGWRIETDRGDRVIGQILHHGGRLPVGGEPVRPSRDARISRARLPHRRMAARRRRFHRASRRRHRHRLVGDPVDPDHRGAGIRAHRVPAHRDLFRAGLERRS